MHQRIQRTEPGNDNATSLKESEAGVPIQKTNSLKKSNSASIPVTKIPSLSFANKSSLDDDLSTQEDDSTAFASIDSTAIASAVKKQASSYILQ